MTKSEQIKEHVSQLVSDTLAIEALEPCYLDAMEARNNAPFKSAAFFKAIEEANRIECLASQFAFCDNEHSFTECLKEVALMSMDWEVTSDDYMAGCGRPISIKKGTTAYRQAERYYVLCFRQEKGELKLWKCYVPEHVVDHKHDDVDDDRDRNLDDDINDAK
jgi:hypothetical protein